MHMDEIAARRTLLGAPVVHGVHLLCWALESLLARSGGVSGALKRVTVAFTRGVLVGENVQVSGTASGGEFNLSIHRNQAQLAGIKGSFGPAFEYSETLAPVVEQKPCRVMDSTSMAGASGTLPLFLEPKDARRLFPGLSAALPDVQLAFILATTRLVGMECPGLHSLYSALDLSFDGAAAGAPEMNYKATPTDRFGGFLLSVEGPGARGEIRAFLRPAPRAQVEIGELAKQVEAGEFSNQKALVIGGSRGLGEVVAKLLAVGGADVTITWHRGKADAESVAGEIVRAGGRCGVAHFDVNRPMFVDSDKPFTHLYYFATPHITADKSVAFSAERFEQYCQYYVTNFALTLLMAGRDQELTVFYPSTIFLDKGRLNTTEYCAAKAAGEEVCKQMMRRFPEWRIYAPRLPRMATDQNNGIMPVRMEAAETVMLRELRQMRIPREKASPQRADRGPRCS